MGIVALSPRARAMAEVRAEIEAGRHATAARILTALVAERPEWDEAAYLLGTCEQATGRARAAALAWARVPAGSAFAPQAIQRLVELEVEKGRFAAAEELVERAIGDPRNDATALPLFLGPIFWLQGRTVDAGQAIEARWNVLNDRGEGASEKAIDLVRLHIELTSKPLPVEAVRNGLDEAGRLAPDDDRVWLGKANLAIRIGKYDEAERYLPTASSAGPRTSRSGEPGSTGRSPPSASPRPATPSSTCLSRNCPCRRVPGWPHGSPPRTEIVTRNCKLSRA